MYAVVLLPIRGDLTRLVEKESSLDSRRKISRLDKANTILGWSYIFPLPIGILWEQHVLGNVWLIAALLVSVLLPLGQWYCREKADRMEGTHNRRRKERNDNLKIETDQDLTHLMG